MADAASERLLSGRAWSDFCDVLKVAGEIVDRFEDIDDLDRTEWYRCLSRYTRGMLERYVEAGDPGRLELVEMAWRHSINCTSPMQDQLFAEFDPAMSIGCSGIAMIAPTSCSCRGPTASQPTLARGIGRPPGSRV
ncbi:MAG: hypothetical protein IPF48_05375 [Sphingomonadales bacterium]|nr:hypothetical protein [Sphingomonadales bacterium]